MEQLVVNNIALAIQHIHIADNRSTIIFLHDSLGCIELWRDFPADLGKATNCNVLVYDRQGYGKSSAFTGVERDNYYMEKEADVLNELIQQLGIKNAILFGHSDGGSIALIAAAKQPKNAMAVITEGAHIFVEDITLQGIRAGAEAYRTTNLKERLQKYHGDKTEAMFWAWAKTWLTDKFQSWNIEAFLPNIECPVLIIQGDNDEYGTIAQVDGIVSQVSGKAVKLMIPEIGHTPHKEAREIVLKESAAFIAEIIA
jgi:pimeloyl-ACP methyl ester carboxylesterase